jgi:ATP-dependent DNA ligase
MEARSVDEIPTGTQWQYEPKWDGFRCLVFRDGGKVELQSKSGQPLTRYFPELVEAVLAVKATRLVLDGEIVVPRDGAFSFDDLLQRIHPAQSRVRRLAAETPALLIVFDLLVGADGKALIYRPLHERRNALEAFAHSYLRGAKRIRLSPATTKLSEAKRWLRDVGATLDGIIAKRCDLDYRSEDRSGMQKIKNYRSADCVVGGFRYNEGKPVVGSLLLGLYDRKGLLHHVGFTSTSSARTSPHSPASSRSWWRRPVSLETRRAGRAAGRPNGRPNGNRSSPSSWSRSATTISPANASATAPSCCAGAPTRRRTNARSSR